LILFVVTIVISLLAGVTDYLVLLFYATAAMAALANLIHLAGYIPGRMKFMASPLTHFGFGVMLIGVMASSAFDTSQRVSIPLGGSADADQYGVQLGYSGMVNEIDYPNNELLLSLDEGSGPREVRPQFYYSARMDGIMRRPYISRNLGYDLYLAPQQIMSGEEDQGLVMHDGDTKEVAGVKITFTGFDVVTPESGEMGGIGMSVTANLEVNNYGTISKIGPTIRQAADESGRPTMVNEPGKILVDGREYDVEIAKIFADDGTVVLNIPGLTGGAPDQLVMDVSKKPMINMVWFGTTMILIGSILSIYRRRSELVKADE
jgi:cytochrome c-type biogenesis protein CcmF